MTDHRREAAELQRRFEALAADHPDVPLAMFEMPLDKPAREVVERYIEGLGLPTFALFDDWFTVAMEPDAAHATVELLASAGDVLRSIERQMPGTVDGLLPVRVNQTPNPDKLAACSIFLGVIARRVDVEAVKAGRPSDGWEQIDAVAELFEGGPMPASTRLMGEWACNRERWGSLLVVSDIHAAAAEALREALGVSALSTRANFYAHHLRTLTRRYERWKQAREAWEQAHAALQLDAVTLHKPAVEQAERELRDAADKVEPHRKATLAAAKRFGFEIAPFAWKVAHLAEHPADCERLRELCQRVAVEAEARELEDAELATVADQAEAEKPGPPAATATGDAAKLRKLGDILDRLDNRLHPSAPR